MKNRYTKAEGNVTKITEALEQHQMRLMKDSAVLDKMYEQNLAYLKNFPCTFLQVKRSLGKSEKASYKRIASEGSGKRTSGRCTGCQ